MRLFLRRMLVLSVLLAAVAIGHFGEIPEPEPPRSADGSPLHATGAFYRTADGGFRPADL